MDPSGQLQDTFGGRGLARINVGENTYVSIFG
jgi:hypothetical protein